MKFRLSKNSRIHYLLVVRSCKLKEIGNYYWHDKLKLNCLVRIFVVFFQWVLVLPNKTRFLNPDGNRRDWDGVGMGIRSGLEMGFNFCHDAAL